MQNNPSSTSLQAPQILVDDIVSLDVTFFDFNGIEKSGIIEVHKSIEQDIRDVFNLIYKLQFPIHSAQPVSRFNFDDDISMQANNTSAYNFRTVALDPTRVSNHGYGLAIDINPVQNPYIKEEVILPPTSIYNVHTPGTLNKEHPIVVFMKDRGFIWGGDWDKPYLDYQHFHKEPSVELLAKYSYEIKNILHVENRP